LGVFYTLAVPEPPTHYQLSFTARQAMALFVGLLVALGLAYFLGLMTGLAGHEAGKTGTATPAPAPTATERIAATVLSTPTAIRPIRTPAAAVPPFPRPVLGMEPTAATSIQLFEDRSESEPTPPAAKPTAAGRPAGRAAAPAKPSPAPAAAAGEFWVQVMSLSSEREARMRRDKLIHGGYRARIFVAEGPKGAVYRLRVGPYTSREEAARASDRLSKQEKVRAWIVPAGK
jgi:DedD protein